MDRKSACTLCHSSIEYSVPEFDGYRICRVCDVTWCTEEDPPDLFCEWEEQYYGRDDVFKHHEARRSGMEAIIARLNAVCPARGRLLDIGTGLGILMRVAARSGWLVEGVEPSRLAAEWAQKLSGSVVHNDFLEALNLPEAHYDAITVLDTIRSVPDPIPFLQRIRKLMRPGGVLLVREVYREFLRRTRWLMNRSLALNRQRHGFDHAQCFSPKSLTYAMNTVGLTGWVEPSPVFIESVSTDNLMVSLSRRTVGLASSTLYRYSGNRIVFSPNLLAFGRAPVESSPMRVQESNHSFHRV